MPDMRTPLTILMALSLTMIIYVARHIVVDQSPIIAKKILETLYEKEKEDERVSTEVSMKKEKIEMKKEKIEQLLIRCEKLKKLGLCSFSDVLNKKDNSVLLRTVRDTGDMGIDDPKDKDDIIKLFLDYGADVTQIDRFGHTVLHLAFFNSFNMIEGITNPVARTLLDHIKKEETLTSAFSGEEEKRKAYVNQAAGNTRVNALWLEGVMGSKDCTLSLDEKLLQLGADCNLYGDEKNQPTRIKNSFWAKYKNHECMKIYLENGLDINLHRILDPTSEKCVLAFNENQDRATKLDHIINHIESPDFRKNKEKMHQLKEMMTKPGASILILLTGLWNQNEVSKLDKLHTAPYFLKKFIEYGAIIDQKDVHGLTALDYAQKLKKTNFENILVREMEKRAEEMVVELLRAEEGTKKETKKKNKNKNKNKSTRKVKNNRTNPTQAAADGSLSSTSSEAMETKIALHPTAAHSESKDDTTVDQKKNQVDSMNSKNINIRKNTSFKVNRVQDDTKATQSKTKQHLGKEKLNEKPFKNKQFVPQNHIQTKSHKSTKSLATIIEQDQTSQSVSNDGSIMDEKKDQANLLQLSQNGNPTMNEKSQKSKVQADSEKSQLKQQALKNPDIEQDESETTQSQSNAGTAADLDNNQVDPPQQLVQGSLENGYASQPHGYPHPSYHEHPHVLPQQPYPHVFPVPIHPNLQYYPQQQQHMYPSYAYLGGLVHAHQHYDNNQVDPPQQLVQGFQENGYACQQYNQPHGYPHPNYHGHPYAHDLPQQHYVHAQQALEEPYYAPSSVAFVDHPSFQVLPRPNQWNEYLDEDGATQAEVGESPNRESTKAGIKKTITLDPTRPEWHPDSVPKQPQMESKIQSIAE